MKNTPDKSKEKESIYIVSDDDFESLKKKSVKVEDFKKSDDKELEETLYYFGVFIAVMLIFFHHQIFYFISRFISFLFN